MQFFMGFLILYFFLFAPSAVGDPLVEKGNRGEIHLGTWSAAPFSSADGKGLLDQMMKEAFKRCCDLDAVVTSLPAERALKVANKGLVDGDLPRIANISGPNGRYPNLLQVDEAVLPTSFVAFSKNSDIRVNEWDKLESYHVAIVTGWKILERNILKYRSLTKVKNVKNLFVVLEKDRAEVVIVTRLVGLTIIHQMGLKGIYGADSPIFKTKKDKWYLYMHKKNKGLVPKLKAALYEMKKDGSFAKIYCQSFAGYLPPDDADSVIMNALAYIGAKYGASCRDFFQVYQ